MDLAIHGDIIMFVGGEDADIVQVRYARSSASTGTATSPRWSTTGSGRYTQLRSWRPAELAGLEPDVGWAAVKGGAADSFVMQHEVPPSSSGTMNLLSSSRSA